MMTRVHQALSGFASGVILNVAGLYAWLGELSLLFAAIGLLVILVSAGVLLLTQDLRRLRSPHPCIWIPFGLAVALNIYEFAVEASGPFAFGWFAWMLAPQILAVLLSCFAAVRVSAVAAACAALLVDVWTFYSVFVAPGSSTAAIAMIWMPLWSILIVVPAATWLAWLLIRRAHDTQPR